MDKDTDDIYTKINELKKKVKKQDKKINIFLDLDQTLISAEPLQIDSSDDEVDIYDIEDEENKKKVAKFAPEFSLMENLYVIFERPKLQKFLDYLFKNFNVSIWTAATKDYALHIIEEHILKNKPERKIDYLFFSYHCKISNKIGKGTKDLSLLWNVWKIPNYNVSNTFILDDYDEIYDIQLDNCLVAKPFYFTEKESDQDTFLLNMIKLLKMYKKELLVGNRDVVKIINES
jgi:TFIIF-interacting CTD phosphatase-like protein